MFRIVDADNDAAPYALVDDHGENVTYAASTRELSDYAFAKFGEEIEVRHDEDLIQMEERLRR